MVYVDTTDDFDSESVLDHVYGYLIRVYSNAKVIDNGCNVRSRPSASSVRWS